MKVGAKYLFWAFVVGNILDVLSTLYFVKIDGGWQAEANPIVEKILIVGGGHYTILFTMILIKILFVWLFYKWLTAKKLSTYRAGLKVTLLITCVLFFAVNTNFSHVQPTPNDLYFTETPQGTLMPTPAREQAIQNTFGKIGMVLLGLILFVEVYEWLLLKDYELKERTRFG